MISIILISVAGNLLLAIIPMEDMFEAQGEELIKFGTTHLPERILIKLNDKNVSYYI
jgi:hypothetical protein